MGRAGGGGGRFVFPKNSVCTRKGVQPKDRVLHIPVEEVGAAHSQPLLPHQQEVSVGLHRGKPIRGLPAKS